MGGDKKAPAPVAQGVVTVAQLAQMFGAVPSKGLTEHDHGVRWGWNQAVRRAIEIAQPAPAPVATKDCEAVREAGRAADASVSFYNETMGAAPAPAVQAGEYQQTRETLAACPPESTLHALSQQALTVLGKLHAPAPVALSGRSMRITGPDDDGLLWLHLTLESGQRAAFNLGTADRFAGKVAAEFSAPAPVSQGEPVAVIGSGYQLLWASGEPLADTVKRTGIKVGSVLYTATKDPRNG